MPFCEANFVYLLGIIFIFISRQKRKNQRTTSRVPLLRQRSAILFTRGTHFLQITFLSLTSASELIGFLVNIR